MTSDNELLLRIAAANHRTHATWDEAVNLGDHFGVPLKALRHRVVRDRLLLAEETLKSARRQHRARPVMYRSAVGRYYYAMYHAMRAVVFHVSEGDDYQEHKTLPSHVPSDFPSAASRENELKDIRESRNRVDYDPYLLTDLKTLTTGVRDVAIPFVRDCRAYLTSRGVTI